MFYSPEKEILFIHIPKTGGSSLKSALVAYAGADPAEISRHPRLDSFVRDRPERLVRSGMVYPNHMSVREVQRLTSIDIETVTSFAVVRNPWTRLPSLFHHILRDPRHAQHELASQMGFKGFLSALVDPQRPVRAPDLRPQINYLLDENGTLGVRYLLKQERLAQGLSLLCDRLSLKISLPRVNISPPAGPEVLQDPETREMIDRHEQGIIRLLGYSEDQPDGLAGDLIELK